MDYLSRLVGGAGSSPTRQAGHDTAQQRAIRFKRAHDQLQQIWRKNNGSNVLASAVSVLTCLESIKKILEDELQTPVPHLCARHVSTFQVYNTLVQVASNYYDELIIHEILDIFKIFIDSEEVEFLEETGFADALIGFVGKLSTAGASNETQSRIAEALFGVASKLRLQPQLLPTWFRPSPKSSANTFEQGGNGPTVNANSDAFPLFYLTLDYVHHDGRVGDFARTGLLYIVESATSSEALEKWIVESDLATLMASGLGALYSQLSRKLVLSFPKDSVPAIVTFSKAGSSQIPPDAETTTSSDFRAHLATFLSYLVFWQDVLEHCRSDDIKRSLLDHFKFLFLQQLLYPSLIESSDVDGGSSVAVLTYLRCIIESIDHAELLHVTLQYLLALPEPSEDESKPARPTTLARRRKSSMLVTNLAQGLEKPMPDLFTLVDLILTSLKSRDHPTVTATLQLVSVLLQSQHQYAVLSIVKIQTCNDDMAIRTIDEHNRNTEILFSMAEDLIEHDDLRNVYEAHLHDARSLIELHCCSAILLTLPGPGVGDRMMETSKIELTKIVRPHSIRLDDPLTDSMLSLLQNFLANDIHMNLSLTQAFASLASCANTCLERWLLGDPLRMRSYLQRNIVSASDSGESDHDDTITIDTKAKDENTIAEPPKPEDIEPIPRKSTAYDKSPSPVYVALDSLVQQVETFRHTIQEFDTYLAERRHAFKVGEDNDMAVTNDVSVPRKAEERSPGERARMSTSQDQGAPHLASIPKRLVSETSSSSVSRSSSPRGRQPSDPLSSTSTERLNHLRISPSPSPSQSASRPFSPSPLRKDTITSIPPKRIVTPTGQAGIMQQRVKIRTTLEHNIRDVGSSETSSLRSESTAAEARNADAAAQEITLDHLLTNIIILQEFILELAAIIEVRAGLFGEVKFV